MQHTAEIRKRFRKWGGVVTGNAQNAKDLPAGFEIENIIENSDFVYMLNQADKGVARPGRAPCPENARWGTSTIAKILTSRECCGNPVNFKACSKSLFTCKAIGSGDRIETHKGNTKVIS